MRLSDETAAGMDRALAFEMGSAGWVVSRAKRSGGPVSEGVANPRELLGACSPQSMSPACSFTGQDD